MARIGREADARCLRLFDQDSAAAEGTAAAAADLTGTSLSPPLIAASFGPGEANQDAAASDPCVSIRFLEFQPISVPTSAVTITDSIWPSRDHCVIFG